MIRSLIWDAGGTLFDTYPALVKACQSVLKPRGIEADDTWLMQLFRQTTSHAISRLAETFDLDDESLERELREAYAQMPPKIQPPFPGVVAVCRYMLKTGGANFIVTHRDWQLLRPMLDHYEMRNLFVHWITADDGYPRKPNPASICAVIDQYGLTADECLAIGDREIDIIAARRAGTLSCFYTRREARSTISADLVIKDFFELLTWLQTEYQDIHNQKVTE